MGDNSRPEDHELDNEITYGNSVGPTRKRTGLRNGPKMGRPARAKKGSTQRKGNTKGGIHQRGNKRMSW